MNFFRTPAGSGASKTIPLTNNETETSAESATNGTDSCPKNTNCAKCNSKFLVVSATIPKPDCVKCSYCTNWVCLQCITEKSSMSRPTAMALLEKSSIEFHCGLCQKPSIADLLAIIKELKANNEQLSTRLASLESNLPPPPLTASTGFDLESLLAKVTAAATKAAVEAVTESMERKEKKLNLVAVGWPERGDNDREVATNDQKKVHDYCENLNIDPGSVIRTFRDGNSTRRLADGRFVKANRIMKICFSDLNNRRVFLTKTSGLLRVDPEMANLTFKPFVRPDMTMQERQADRALREVAKARRDAGEDVIVRNGQIVARQHVGMSYATAASQVGNNSN